MKRKASTRRQKIGAKARRLTLEPLEGRRLLSTTPIITEFMASNDLTILDGDGESSDWVELHNPTDESIDLAGWHLTDNAATPTEWSFPSLAQSVIEPGEYLLVFASGQDVSDYVDAQGYLHTNFKLTAGGEYLALSDASANIVQEFAPEYPAQSTDVSYGLDQSDEAVFFTNATPGAINDFSSASATTNVKLSEIMYHPSSELTTEEYIELYNDELIDINVSGWRLTGGVEFEFPSVTIPTGDYLVVAADVPTFSAKYPGITNVVGGWSGRLSNSNDNLRLLDSNGVPVDQVEYFDQGQWAVRERGPEDSGHEGWQWSDAHDGGGSSLEVVNLSAANSFGQNWLASTQIEGTPGAANSVADADDNTAPFIVDTRHSPAIPSSSDIVTITTRLLDESDSITNPSVMWRVDGNATFESAILVDDGTDGDARANDGIYSAELPAQADGTVIEWYIAVSDGTGNTRNFPAASQPSGLQETNLLYQVDDSFDPSALIGEDDLSSYRLIMTEAERAELEQIGSNSSEASSHALMNGTFISVSSDGIDVRYNAGFRNRGRSSRARQPNSYRVNLPSDAPWQGIDQFNLNTQYTYLQLIGMRMFEEAGIPAEDVSPVNVRVNGNDLSFEGAPSYSIYVQVEAHNSHFAENNFPDDSNGNLYRVSRDGGGPGGQLQDQGPDLEPYLEFYEKKTNVGDNDYSDLLNLIQVLNTTDDADYFKEVSKVMDVSQWLEYFVGVSVLGSQETMLGTGVGDDYLLYRGVNDPRFVVLAHDFDTILGQGDTAGDPEGSIYRPLVMPTMARFLTHPESLRSTMRHIATCWRRLFQSQTSTRESTNGLAISYRPNLSPKSSNSWMPVVNSF